MLFIALLLAFLSLVEPTPGPKNVDEDKRFTKCRPSKQNIYDFQVQDLHGKYTDLTSHKGKVLLVVNVATYCAYTQQYLDFNPLIEGTNDSIAVLAFPCNQFYLQEPAENHEIMNGVLYVRPGNGWKPHKNLHFYGKLEVNGVNQHPLYEFLKDLCPQTVKTLGKKEEMMYNPIEVNDITWNFEKFLVDKKGKVRYRFHPTAWRHGEAVKSFVKELMAEH